MLLPSWTLQIIVDKVFGQVLEQSGVSDSIRTRLGLEPTRLAFQETLNKTLNYFEQQYPLWASDLFKGI